MLSLVPNDSKRYSLSETIHAEVSRFLYQAFTADSGLLSNVDRWTQRRVTMENLTKIELAHASDDPVEYCYQNLIREIDAEAQTGIFLVGKDTADTSLGILANEPGVSGKLRNEVAYIAPVLFADALAHSNDQLDLVWVTIRARFERARGCRSIEDCDGDPDAQLGRCRRHGRCASIPDVPVPRACSPAPVQAAIAAG